MEIRKMFINDIEICSRILKNEYQKSPYNEIFERDYNLQYIQEKYSKNSETSFVIEIDGKVVGFCISSVSYWANGPQGIIEEIVIDSNFQSKGLGKKIYNYVEKHFKKLGVKSILLWCKKDSKAFNFHQKNGFNLSEDYSIMFKNL